ncbi:MAG: hypothetical protein IPO41_13155 [Acidobacteria bacterium]|nr:hypothetical protein [Acidobacteriota bacterium]
MKNLNKDIALSYYETDFRRTKTNPTEYMRAVGPYLGLVANTGSPGYGTTPLVGSNISTWRQASAKAADQPRSTRS